MKIRIYDIEWDLYDEDEGRELTLSEVDVPMVIDIEVPKGEDIYDYAEEHLGNYDWCVKNFKIKKNPKDWDPDNGKICKNEEPTELDDIRGVLRQYFEYRSNGEKSREYDDCFSAQDALDEIAGIVGWY